MCTGLRFLYDGARIQDEDTPASLDMEDGGKHLSFQMFGRCLNTPPDTIDVMVERKHNKVPT